jgi:catechol 1,2-dioxygenase
MSQARPTGWLTQGSRALLVACVPTAETVTGPFYRRGAPWRSRLCSPDEPGDPLTVTGTVTAMPDCRAVVDATLDIWQTNARGLYSNLLGLGSPAKPRTFHLRGRTQTDQHGRYRFESIIPGRYPLFWPFTRPRHIHVIVTHPSCQPLITQIYFHGDRYNQWDPWWHRSLTIHVQSQIDAAHRRGYHGIFDIVVQRR